MFRNTFHSLARLAGRLLLAGLVALLLALAAGLVTAQQAWAAPIVTNPDDSGPGSLRQAIADAAPGETITFQLSGCPCTILLASELVIDKSLTISGPGAQLFALSGNDAVRVVHVRSGASVTLEGLTIRNGFANQGGGIYNAGMLTLRRVTVTQNQTTRGSDCSHSSCRAQDGGHGGGIYNVAALTVTQSTISSNTTGAGGNVMASDCSDLCSAGDGGFGGGIYNVAALTVTQSTISSNTTGAGGNVMASDCSHLCIAGDGGFGGGIYNFLNATLTVTQSTISSNTTGAGGNVMASDCSHLCIARLGGYGGGIYNQLFATLNLSTSTLSGNTTGAGGTCAALSNCFPGEFGRGGGLSAALSSPHLTNVTITKNQGSAGGGIDHRAGGSLNLANSIVAGNVYESGAPNDCSSINGGEIVSQGYNLVGSGTGCPSNGSGDQAVPPASVFTTVLGPLQDNGGPTWTHALVAGSPAIDAGNPTPAGSGGNACTLTDQRNFLRTDRCDSGAFELGATPPDSTPPVIEAVVTGTLGQNGWYVGDVSVSWTVSDEESAITSQQGCEPVTINADTAGTTLTCSATSAGGTATESVTIKRDATAPTITASVTKANNTPYAAGSWSNQTVTVQFTCDDSTSGVASCPAAQTVSSEGVTAAVPGTATDQAGNSAGASFGPIQIDLTPPTISGSVSPAPNAAGWHNSDVTVTFTCGDNLSGVVSCGPEQTLANEGAEQVVNGTATDQAGNSASTSVDPLHIDKTPPVVTVTGVDNGAAYILGEVPQGGCTTEDPLSGVATEATFSISGGNPDGTGSFTATCSGASDHAGNTASATVSYRVGYNWTGFLAPVQNPPVVNTANAGQAIPLKFSLGGNYGLTIFASGYPVSQQVSCGTGGGEGNAIEETATPGTSSLQYDPASDTYTYVWKTEKAWAGTCRLLTVRLIDGSEHGVLFQFKGKGRSPSEEPAEQPNHLFLPLVTS